MRRTSLAVESYYPDLVNRILRRCEAEPFEQYLLIGFSEGMKWLSRIFTERGVPFLLADWRPAYIGYDCSNDVVRDLDAIQVGNDGRTCAILCCQEAEPKKQAALRLAESRLRTLPVLIEHDAPCELFTDTEFHSTIHLKAAARGKSLNSADRLQVLTQLVGQTRNVPGDVAEFGTFNGGSASYILETLKAWKTPKRLLLFDSFGGMPAPGLGVDYRWDRAFSNNSFAEVRAMFEGEAAVSIVKGDIRETIEQLPETLSFVHIDVDTLETGRRVTEHVWNRLSAGGILLYDDYGFYPNCIPLTAFVDRFFSERGCFKFHLPTNTCFIMKPQTAGNPG